MKKKMGGLILLVGLVALIGGAYMLYQKLSAEKRIDFMVQQDGISDGNLEQTEESQEASISEESTAEDSEAGAEEETEQELSLAPGFYVTDREGNQAALSDFYGKPVVVNFWASWCGPCKSEMPDFQTAYETYKGEVNFLMVNMTDGARETVEKADEFISRQGYTFPVFFDTESEAAIAYGVRSIPSTFFIDKEGYAVAYAQGAIDGETLEKGLAMIMEGKGE